MWCFNVDFTLVGQVQQSPRQLTDEEMPERSKWFCLAKVHMSDQLATRQISLAETLAISAQESAMAVSAQAPYRVRISTENLVLPIPRLVG